MKGVIFNLFEDFVCEGFGDDTYEAILDEADLQTEGPFVGPGLYPDADLLELVGRTIARLGIPLRDALRAFGRFALPRLVASHPDFADSTMTAKEFLVSVDGVIHVEVQKLFPDAITPRLVCEDAGPDRLVMTYRSERGFCHLVEGFLDGVSDHFGTKIDYHQSSCAHDGADACRFELGFSDGAA